VKLGLAERLAVTFFWFQSLRCQQSKLSKFERPSRRIADVLFIFIYFDLFLFIFIYLEMAWVEPDKGQQNCSIASRLCKIF
jgi:hypothetical protein